MPFDKDNIPTFDDQHPSLNYNFPAIPSSPNSVCFPDTSTSRHDLFPYNQPGPVLKTPPVPSVLDNKETLLHFLSPPSGKKAVKKSFVLAYYRHRNLKLATLLDSLCPAENSNTAKAIRHLRFCSSSSIIQLNLDNTANVFQSSKTCKNPHCSICSRIRSARLSSRLKAAICDPNNATIFDNRYWYFMTCTVRHNKDCRNYNYLREFKTYLKSLFRSKAWSKYFGKVKGRHTSGCINSIECTITDNGYHIHSHSLILANRLQSAFSSVQSDLQLTWKKITSDSNGLRFDAISYSNIGAISSDTDFIETKVFSAIMEVFKYTTKTGSLGTMNTDKLELLSNWIDDTKGMNFVNASGLFRGLQLAGCKSKYDSKSTPSAFSSDLSYFIGKTSRLLFSIYPGKELSSTAKKKAFENAYMVAISKDFICINDAIFEVAELMKCGYSEDQLDRHLSWIVNKIITLATDNKDEITLSHSEREAMKERARVLASQKTLFDNTHDFLYTSFIHSKS